MDEKLLKMLQMQLNQDGPEKQMTPSGLVSQPKQHHEDSSDSMLQPESSLDETQEHRNLDKLWKQYAIVGQLREAQEMINDSLQIDAS